MKTAIVTIKGVAPISFSKNVDIEEFPRFDGEGHDDYDARIWKEKAHYEGDQVVVTGAQFKFALDATAKLLSIQKKGSSTWTKTFLTGIVCPDNMTIGSTREKLQFVRVHCSVNGIRGGTSRVWRHYPIIHQWGGDMMVYVVNDEIDEQIFVRHLEKVGAINGLGRYRPERGGNLGRFVIENIEWQDDARI